jgi:di/tricarboxylate transporter
LPNKTDFNYTEHLNSYPNFLTSLFVSALAGIVLGVIIDKITNFFDWDCAILVFVELFLIISTLYVLFKFKKTSKLFFDDWFWGTFSGFMFTIGFFSAVPSLSDNIACAVK